MNDELKEILEDLKNKDLSVDDLTHNDKTKLLDYITNLQEEVNKLTAKSTEWESKFYDLQEENERLQENNQSYQEEMARTWKIADDYKSRNEKAIEYCNYNDESLYTFEPDYDYEENMVDNYEPSNFREDLLNILNGGENNVKDKR